MDDRPFGSGLGSRWKVRKISGDSSIVDADQVAAGSYFGADNFSWISGISVIEYLVAVFSCASSLGVRKTCQRILCRVFNLSGSEHHERGRCCSFLAFEVVGTQPATVLCCHRHRFTGFGECFLRICGAHGATCGPDHDSAGCFLGFTQAISLGLNRHTTIDRNVGFWLGCDTTEIYNRRVRGIFLYG
ncbi:MAG: hypothetical protein ACD_23C01086G0002 [uncultured bacterium]|nr:MAG: hypothetical protein ACD_23C01086G0002 [uncultured bacterium]